MELMGIGMTVVYAGLIFLLKALEANAFGDLTRLKGLTGVLAAYLTDVTEHAKSKGLSADLLAHRADLDRRLILPAAASAPSSAQVAGRPRKGLATRAMGLASGMPWTPTGANLWQIPRRLFAGSPNSVIEYTLTQARTSGGRQKNRRDAVTLAVRTYLHICAAGRAYGPGPQAATRRRSRGTAAGGGAASGPGSLRATRQMRARHSSLRGTAFPMAMNQLLGVAAAPRPSAREFESEIRLGQRLPLLRAATATLPPAPATARRTSAWQAHRLPPPTPPPAWPGTSSTPVPSARALIARAR